MLMDLMNLIIMWLMEDHKRADTKANKMSEMSNFYIRLQTIKTLRQNLFEDTAKESTQADTQIEVEAGERFGVPRYKHSPGRHNQWQFDEKVPSFQGGASAVRPQKPPLPFS